MVGIISYGVHIPLHRLPKAMIAASWESRAPAGEKAVANHDEDSLTMAVAAARDCLKKVAVRPDAVYFATTTAPYKEKQSAALIAAVLSCGPETQTLDFGNSLRAGTSALSAAVNAVAAGACETVLVLASDLRMAYPKGPQELSFGDAAVAFLIGKANVVAEIESFYTHFDEIQDTWRSDKDTFVRTAEARFAEEYGYNRVIKTSVAKALAKAGLKAEDVTSVCTNFPNAKAAQGLFAKLGFAGEGQFQGNLHGCVGDTGTSMSLLYLAAALEKAEAGNRFLVANYGSGCDVVAVKTTDANADIAKHASFKKQLENKRTISSYNKFLIWRELMETQPAARPPVSERQPTPSAQFREVKWELALNGTKCNACGAPQYPPQRVCMICKTKDQMASHNFSDLKGKVSSFSHDHMMETLDSPVTLTIVDFEGGGRIMCDMTDRDPAKTEVGMEVEMTFRKLYYVGGIYNYWWKCKPAA